MEIAAKQSVENIPDSHCRIKEEAYNRKLLNLCENAKTRTDGKIKYIVVMENYNLQITRNGDYKLYNREKRCRKIKEERQATVSAIYGGIISVAFPVALFALWLAIGY